MKFPIYARSIRHGFVVRFDTNLAGQVVYDAIYPPDYYSWSWVPLDEPGHWQVLANFNKLKEEDTLTAISLTQI